MTEPDLTAGHRKRLRERFIKSGISGFQDYEIVELLLTLGSPRKDCKQQAKEALRRFKTLRGVLEAPPAELQEIDGIGPHNAFGLKLVQEVAREFLKQQVIEQPVFQSSQQVFDYLYHAMRDHKKEVFKVIFLDSRNRILEMTDLPEGTVNASFVSPREIFENAFKHHAVSLIFVHNHPSGSPEPSSSDKDLTRELVFAAATVQLKVLDHIIIGDNRFYSFAGSGLIDRYQLDFQTLKMTGGSPPADGSRTSSPKLPWLDNF